ncbi:DUF2238 domain-containing protein [Pontibacter akesuensis]|uniref:Putative membrane protein n=1 Tax=Pontibacter akesuensis TaxID=388950 RepID=A0A1I7K9G8_9BACT|nr:DUF2238 domain-containing protein [Pontibacter akesuensis]GHA74026.1 membrane protein [Pontibacter akesuensis]SFU94032.1 putative membrane protein [Pontibacter akesuensis]
MTTKPDAKKPYLKQPLHLFYSALLLIFWVYTAITTPNFDNWIAENILTVSLIIILGAFYNIFRFSNTSYTCIFLFLLLHIYGSQYQYANNPFGDWLQQQFSLQRNHYDRLVHFGYGLLLAYPIHEVLARGFRVRRFYSYLLPVEIILSTGALYELLEWIVADWVYGGGEKARAFLGMQGDPWDAQKDLALAVAGAAITMSVAFVFSKKKKDS